MLGKPAPDGAWYRVACVGTRGHGIRIDLRRRCLLQPQPRCPFLASTLGKQHRDMVTTHRRRPPFSPGPQLLSSPLFPVAPPARFPRPDTLFTGRKAVLHARSPGPAYQLCHSALAATLPNYSLVNNKNQPWHQPN